MSILANKDMNILLILGMEDDVSRFVESVTEISCLQYDLNPNV
jgi:hypothetical protein